MINEQLETFDLINEIVLLKKNVADQTITKEETARLADLEEYAHTHLINLNLFGVTDRVWNNGSLLPYFDEQDVENMVCLTNQLCYQYFNRVLIHQELKQAAVAIIVEKAEERGNSFQVETAIVTLCANQLISEAIRLSDYKTLEEE